jgi:tetratricopeptide (TPR) repeat protein
MALLLGGALSLSHAAFGQANPGAAASGLGGPDVGEIIVRVRPAGGGALDSLATVNVYTQYHQLYTSASAGPASVRFQGVPLGTYIVEATVPGYFASEEQVELMNRNDQQQVSLVMRLLSDPSGKPVVNKPPLLAGKAQKELAKGLEELRAGRADEARKHLLNAQKLAPSNPDVNYLLGVLESNAGNVEQANAYWEKTVSFYPNHTFALIALGESRIRQGDYPASADFLKRAAAADPKAWRPHDLMARIDMQNGAYEEAEKEARSALELGKEQAKTSRLVLARALIGQRKYPEAKTLLEEFLALKPDEAPASSARKLLEGLARIDAETANRTAADTASGVAPEAVPPTPPALPPPVKWMPPSVDESVPPVASGVACPMQEVLPLVQKNVVRFTRSLDRFTATELLENQSLNSQGMPISSTTRKFNYLVSMHEIRPGIMNVDEYRDGSLSLDVFPDGIATKGLPSVILIFHPVHQEDFELKCEGMGSWRGIPAWQVHFQQKPDRQGSSRSYRVSGMVHQVPLKGRAWISRDTLQLVRIETDLVSPLPEIRLAAEHQEIDYGPVAFPSRHTELWLPVTTEFYTEFRGKRIHRRLTYSNYLLFSVDDAQKVSAPPTPKSNP